MKTSVSVQEKQSFLEWFIDNIEITSSEMNWFLQDLLEDERTLQDVHFVSDVQYCPKGMIITVTETDDLTFLFFKGHVQTDDVYTAYHELQLYRDEAIYVQINFPYSHDNLLYKNVLRDDIYYLQQRHIVTEEMIAQSIKIGKKNFIEKEIDKALENRDYDKFMYFTNLLKEI